MKRIKFLWQWIVCEYEVHRNIFPPTYPDMMERVLAHHLGMSYENFKIFDDFMRGNE